MQLALQEVEAKVSTVQCLLIVQRSCDPTVGVRGDHVTPKCWSAWGSCDPHCWSAWGSCDPTIGVCGDHVTPLLDCVGIM